MCDHFTSLGQSGETDLKPKAENNNKKTKQNKTGKNNKYRICQDVLPQKNTTEIKNIHKKITVRLL